MFYKTKYFSLLFVLASSALQATEFNYNARIATSYYENINRVQEPESDEVSKSIEGGISIAEDTSSLIADISAEFEALKYENQQVDDQTVGHLNSDVLWFINPGQFEWFISDVLTQTSIDSLLSDAPSNSQNVNAFSTGPNYIMRFNRLYGLGFQARYSDINYEESDLDNDRLLGALSFTYNINSLAEVSLNYHSQVVSFNNDVINDDYNRNDLFIRFDYQGRLRVVEFELGLTAIGFDESEDTKKYGYKLLINNQITRNSSFQFQAARYLNDVNIGLLGGSDQSTVVVSSSDVFINNDYRISYSRESGFGNDAFSIYSNSANYNQQDNLDQKVKGLILLKSINLFRSSRLAFEVAYSNTVFENLDPKRTDDNARYGIRYSYAARRNVTLSLELISESLKSNVLDRNYEDSRAVLSLSYSSR